MFSTFAIEDQTQPNPTHLFFFSLAVLDPMVGHTMDALSPFMSVLCRSDCRRPVLVLMLSIQATEK